jgi:hypothetical protein
MYRLTLKMGVDGFHKWLQERRLTRPVPYNLAVACVCVDLADILHTCARRASTARQLVQQVVAQLNAFLKVVKLGRGSGAGAWALENAVRRVRTSELLNFFFFFFFSFSFSFSLPSTHISTYFYIFLHISFFRLKRGAEREREREREKA